MPRLRDPSKPIKKRAKLRNAGEINTEIARIYRLLDNGQLTPAVAARKVAVLTALRNGMPEAVEHTTGTYTPLAINIFSVPTNHFLTGEQIERSRQGLSIIDTSQCKPLLLEHETIALSEPVTIAASTPRPASDDVIKPELAPVLSEGDFNTMPIEELMRRAGVSVD